ncbi:hypothetical protein [Lentilactobacillus laojiaonis]|uniref:hypothetical protein n=1 Tax=Lentilactobacillus laojiaonis TaxID=2883998 RepID=UPI001D0BBBA1|nr:hypothetical protein [Lentilactobacillus laojiaonis]UDM32281.1 hypothetical protein LHL71_00650 [Lentilactobacillus laojiaonis]
MMNEEKLQKIVDIFASYNVDIKTNDYQITSINGDNVLLDTKSYMPNQLIELIGKILSQQVIKKAWGFFD